MMGGFPGRGARLAAPLALVALVAACSGGGSSSSAHPAAAATTQATSPAPADLAAARALARAEETLRRDRSYHFDAVETVLAARPVTTRVTGTVVKASGVAYTLAVGRTRTQVVRVRSATYVRKVPARWSKLHRPTPVSDPTTTLTALLQGLTGATEPTTNTVTGLLPAPAARAAGVPTAGAPAQVRITLDAAAHVTAIAVRTAVMVGANNVTVTLATTYSRFDRVKTLRPPV